MDLKNIDSVTREALDHYVFPLVSKTDVNSGDPIIFKSGKGMMMTDIMDKSYLDMLSTNTRASSLGFANEYIAKAVYDQLMELHYAGTFAHVADVTVKLSAKIAELAPGELTASTFGGSGSEANENSFKFAREYHIHKGDKPYARKIISRWDAYHGATMGAIGATDILGTRHITEPGVPGHRRIPAPFLYRTPFGMDASEVCDFCVDYLEQEIIHEGPEYVAAFIAEPVMQGDGAQVPPDDYFKKVRAVCDKYDVLLIADEVITGFGRTGKWFAMEHWGIEADIMSTAKAITGGYAPLGASTVTQKIADTLPIFSHLQTYQGHPAACAASLATIGYIEKNDLITQSAEHGAHFLEQLQRLRDLPIVGDVRGLGMWTCVDFTSDKKTKAPFKDGTIKRIVHRCRDMGVLIGEEGTAVEMSPPYIASKDELDTCVDTLEKAIIAEAKHLGIS
ncbi:MAG: aspartate aminotransferase family protein [Rhodospirillaceae bacterium]|nr:aspartate aminotransferase family protein [Rhodospirillaceae bacterium]MBT3926265.1 aspartate aminotransferase family protein [Rhodospirillaceae bacterium]MBT4425847.1 aspartate aminotransferase family protein [Rhodospirillaceae bacterium]MBT5039325.1 aspartate aminotransferase family protein [Rhodospirillaceae bacterium]MBT5677072.1 aspartate aminotransferase family protein [Rhodospirillaceae bacterium]